MRSSFAAVVAEAQTNFHLWKCSPKYALSASRCFSDGGSIDHEVELGCGIEENRVGGGCRHCKVNAGKSRERGSKSNGCEFKSMCCLVETNGG